MAVGRADVPPSFAHPVTGVGAAPSRGKGGVYTALQGTRPSGCDLGAPSLSSEVLFAACELGVFDLLAEAPGPLSAAAVAAGLGTSPRGTERLLDACVSLKLLRVDTTGGGRGEGPGVAEDARVTRAVSAPGGADAYTLGVAGRGVPRLRACQVTPPPAPSGRAPAVGTAELAGDGRVTPSCRRCRE